MFGRVGETRAVLTTVVSRVRSQNVSFIAGSLAYNAFVSLVPLLLLLLVVLGAIGNETLSTQIGTLTESYLTPAAEDVVTDALENTAGQTGLSVAGVLVLLWGTLKIFRGLDTAFAVIYGTTEAGSFLKQLTDGLTVLVVIGLALGAVVAAGAAFAVVPVPRTVLHILNPLLLLGGLSVGFLPLYYILPDTDVDLREALPGAVIAAGGWAVLEVVFQIYASNAAQYEAYGVLGAVLLLVTWLYFSSFVLLLGAVVNAVLAERSRPTDSDHASSDVADASETGTDSPSGEVDDASPGTDRSCPAPHETTTESEDGRRSERAPKTRPVETPVAASTDADRSTSTDSSPTASPDPESASSGSTAETQPEPEPSLSRLAVGCGAVLVVGFALRRVFE